LIQKAIEKLLVGRTAIVIAHRLSTIQSAKIKIEGITLEDLAAKIKTKLEDVKQ